MKACTDIHKECEICKEFRGYKRCDCTFEKEYDHHMVRAEMQTFEPCGRLLCMNCMQLNTYEYDDGSTRVLRSYSCLECNTKF